MSNFIKRLLVIGLFGGLIAGTVGVTYGASKKAQEWADNAVNVLTTSDDDVIRVKFLYDDADFTKTADDKNPASKFSIQVYRNGKLDAKTPVWVTASIGGTTDQVSKMGVIGITGDLDHKDQTLGIEGVRWYSGATFSVTYSQTVALADWGGYIDASAQVIKKHAYHKVGERFITLASKAAATDSNTSTAAAKLGLDKPTILFAVNSADNSATLTATLTPADVTVKTILWSTADAAKVSISATKCLSGESITVKGLATFDGTVAITAKSAVDYTLTAVCLVSYPAAA